MKPERILLVHNFYRQRGGEDEHVEQLAKMFQEKGHQVICHFKQSNEIADRSLYQQMMLPIESVYSHTAHRELQELIKINSPSLIHIHNSFPLIPDSIYDFLADCQIPIVQSIHNYKLMCLNGLFQLKDGTLCERCLGGDFVHGVVRQCYQNSLTKSAWMAYLANRKRAHHRLWRLVKGFICPTQFVASKLIAAGCSEEKIFTIPYFLKDKTVLSQLTKDNDRKSYAIYVGRLSAEKGIMNMLKAFKRLPSIPLKIVGDGPMRSQVEQYIQKEKMTHVSCCGFLDESDRDQLLYEAACLIFPSECYETLGYTILESFRAGIPVIASRLGGRELIVKEAQTGTLFEAGNSDSLTSAVEKYFRKSDQWPGMREAARQCYQSTYHQDAVYQKFIQSYEQILAPSAT